MYGVWRDNPVTEVTNLVTHQESLTMGERFSIKMQILKDF